MLLSALSDAQRDQNAQSKAAEVRGPSGQAIPASFHRPWDLLGQPSWVQDEKSAQQGSSCGPEWDLLDCMQEMSGMEAYSTCASESLTGVGILKLDGFFVRPLQQLTFIDLCCVGIS